MIQLYMLDGHQPVPTADVQEWASWFQSADRRVAASDLGNVHIITVFLGYDPFGGPQPMLFETMIFGGLCDQFQERATTWADAEAMHGRAIVIAKKMAAA